MLQLFFAKEEFCQNLLDGPMGPYLPSLAGKLVELGYSRSQGQRLLLTADALGRWLQGKGVSPTDATVDHVRTYAAIQQRTAAGNFPDTATGLTHLVHFLKPWGIFCKPLACSPADQWLQRFDNYLERVRGLSLSTRRGYVHRARHFLRDSFGETAPDWGRSPLPAFVSSFKPRWSALPAARAPWSRRSAPSSAFSCRRGISPRR